MNRGGATVFKKGSVPWNKGLSYTNKPRSEETKKKMSIAAKGKPKSEAHKAAISIGMNNLPQDVKDRKALAVSLAQKGKTHRKGKTQVAWNKGIHTGHKSANYKGGITKISRLIRRMFEYPIWRSTCYERDDWTCQSCGTRGGYLTVHHIKSVISIIKEYNIKTIVDAAECKLLWDIDNGKALCEECHSWEDNYYPIKNGEKIVSGH